MKNLFFDYATQYRINHESISSSKEFTLTNDEYEDFVHFLEGKEYEYTTESEDLLVKLEKAAKDDKYFNDVEAEYEALKTKLNHKKMITDSATIKNNLMKFVDRFFTTT